MGRHEPPTDRSFYLSVAASTIRFALIVALVLGGVVVINQAFPDAAATGDGTTQIPDGDDGGPVATGPTTAQTGATGGTAGNPDPNVPSPTITGVRIAVFNTTDVTGLAGTVNDRLVADGYEQGQDPADASFRQSTQIFYRSARDKVEAEYIANEYFKKLNIVPAKLQAGEDVSPDVQVAIFLGNDYAALQP